MWGDLLTHTTGFRIQDPLPEDINQDFTTKVSIEDYVVKHMPPVVREPGTSYMYDNFASLLLGLVVQKASGMPYEDYMQQHVFAPLKMDSSGFLLEGKLKDNLATAYDATGKEVDLYNVTPTVMPHGGMLSTGDDVGRFMTAFSERGSG
ncbi:serine hydrolase domain-containing protein [Paenibacillus rhizoplanae]